MSFAATAYTARLGRALALAAAVCYAFSLVLPFVRGRIRLFEIVPVGHNLALPQFADYLGRSGQVVPLIAVVLVAFVAPLVLLLALLPAALAGSRALRGPVAAHLAFWRRLGWLVAAAGIALATGVRASSGFADNPTLYLQAGAWFFVAALVLAAAAATLLAPRGEPCARPASPAPADPTEVRTIR